MLKHLRPDSTLLRKLLLTLLLTLVILVPMSVKAVDTTYSLTLNIDPIGSGSVIANVTGPYNYGQAVLLNATGNPGWSFSAWSGNLTGTENPKSITIDGNMSVTASFTQDEHALTIIEVGSGSVAANVSGPYNYGDVVELNATADAGWTFSAWSGDLTGSTNPESITIDGSKNVTATFTQSEYSLNVNIVGSGSVTKSPDGTSYHYGDLVELNATADLGWTFSGWSGDLSGTSNPVSITMNSSKTVTATFTKKSSTQLIQELIEEVKQYRDSGDIDNNGIANSLIVKLEAANAQLESGNTKAAGNILNAFINHVEAQHGKKNKHITEDAAHQLIEDAEYILSQL